MYPITSNEDFLNEQLTPHFKRSEFTCKCGGKYPFQETEVLGLVWKWTGKESLI